MKLLIVESPAKAKTINKYLGDDFKVVASIGHIRDLPKSNKKALDIEGGFIPHYEISSGKEKVVTEIKSLAKKASEIFLAPDPDREGEAIAWHIKEAAGLHNPKRVVFNEITKDAVIEAIKHPRDIDENLKQAQEARRVLDRLFGYDLSGLIWKKLRYGLSAGRVQSPALRILSEREREILAFIPETYWVLTAQIVLGDSTIDFSCVEEPRDRTRVDEIISYGRTESWSITDVVETEAKRSPYAPFTTSTLQQSASTRLGFSPSRTMSIAQKLYEAGHITYMRTDSTTLSKVALAQASQYITSQHGESYHQFRTYATKSKNAQEAHEAIRPTNLMKSAAGINPEQKALYDLIWKRTIASQMADAKIKRTKLIATTSSGPDFVANGSRILFDGWLIVDPGARGEDVIMPHTTKDTPVICKEIIDTEKQTQPPSRYSEAGLVKELEKRGIGRPSTYASIIQTLIDREYVTKEQKALKPTDTGLVVSSFLEQHFTSYISDDFTAEMENKLDEIADGNRGYVETLRDFYSPFQKAVASKENLDKISTLEKADDSFICPTCGSSMVIKLGRSGKFLSCSRFPDCNGALTIDGEVIKADEPIGTHPVTGEPIFVKVGRYGPYVQCGEMVKSSGKKKKGDPSQPKPKMASIPKGKKLDEVTVADALVYLSLPRTLGQHPETGKNITASIGRFGPYIVHDKDFRSLKTDDVYTITLKRACEILSTPKAPSRRGRLKKKD